MQTLYVVAFILFVIWIMVGSIVVPSLYIRENPAYIAARAIFWPFFTARAIYRETKKIWKEE